VKLLELSKEEFSEFQDFIYKKSGIRVSDRKRTLLSNRIRSRLKAGGFKDYKSYFDYLTSAKGRDELEGFFDVVTTHESFFFRTENHFEWFRDDFITDMINRAKGGEHSKQIRIWSAACSTGEEPYSIAMCLAENKFRLRNWELRILGTDISEQALNSARAGVFKPRSVESLQEKQMKRYFSSVNEGEKWKLKPSLVDMVDFNRHNLIEPLTESDFDCIFIRNVLIYFDAPSKKKVVQNLVEALAEGGYLVVGPSEGIYTMLGDLKKHSTFLYQKC